MIPSACPCAASRYVKKVIKISEWVENEKSGLNLLCIAQWINFNESADFSVFS